MSLQKFTSSDKRSNRYDDKNGREFADRRLRQYTRRNEERKKYRKRRQTSPKMQDIGKIVIRVLSNAYYIFFLETIVYSKVFEKNLCNLTLTQWAKERHQKIQNFVSGQK